MNNRKYLPPLTGLLLLISLPLAQAETVTPLQGQNQQQIQNDIAACQSQAGTGQTSSTEQSQGGERLRGAAKGAVAGAAVTEIRGDEVYDRVDDDIQQEYRQNQARDAAKVGVVVCGSQNRQGRREERRNGGDAAAAQSSSSQNYLNCMSSRGYSVTP